MAGWCASPGCGCGSARPIRWARVRSIEVGGEPLEPERSYLVAACERDGDPPDVLCRLTEVAEPRLLGFNLHDAVTQFLAERGTLSYEQDGRCTAENLPAQALGQGSIEGYTFA